MLEEEQGQGPSMALKLLEDAEKRKSKHWSGWPEDRWSRPSRAECLRDGPDYLQVMKT